MQINKKWFINNKSTVGIGFALSILVGISIVPYLNFIIFRKSNYWVKHSHVVLKSNEELLTLVVDAETGQRSYLLTGEECYLEPHQIAVGRIDTKIKQLRKLTLDNSNQQRRLDALESLIAAKLAVIKQTIDLRQNKGLEAALQVVKTDRGRQLMEEIRRLSYEIATEENQLLQERSLKEQAIAQITAFVIVLGSVAAFGLVLIASFLVNRELTRRKQAQQEQARLFEQLETEQGQLEAILSSMTDGLVVGDLSGNVLTMNPAALRLHEYQSVDEARRHLEEFPDTFELHHWDGSFMPVEKWPLGRLLKGETFSNYEVHLRRIDTGTSWFGCYSGTPVRNKAGEIILVVMTIRDITERMQAESKIKAALQEKEVLLKEVHHRVKNNLQVIDSLFRHQCRNTKEQHTTEILKECQNRVKSMALLHEKLYQSQNLSEIDLAGYIRSLVGNLFDSYIFNANNTTLNINIDNIYLDIETALPCGLIVNEIVSNSLKYAFPAGGKGEITINFHDNANKFLLNIKDNGVGLPKDFDFYKLQSLGLKLVRSLVRQLGGTIEINGSGGTEFIIYFTKDNN